MHEKIRQMEKYISGQEMKKVSQEWKKIKAQLPKDSLNNQQYIARYDAIIKRYNKEMDVQEYFEKLKEALRFTMPDFEKIDIKNWPLSRNEIILLNSIASACYTTGRNDEAKYIYYELWDSIEKSSTNKIYHCTEYRLLSYNIGVLEAREHNYEKAKEILECGIRSCMLAGRIEIIASFLYCLAWSMNEEEKERQKQDNEKARYMLQQAFYLANVLKLPNLCNEICNYYEEEWGERITY